MLDRFLPGSDDTEGCLCRPTRRRSTLVVDARDCPAGGSLESSPDCRETAVSALAGSPADRIRVERGGVTALYEGSAAALMTAAAAFADRVAGRSAQLVDLAVRDPLRAARQARDRAGRLSSIAADTGLSEYANADSLEAVLHPRIGPTMSAARIDPVPPANGTLLDSRVTDSGATVRVYEADGSVPVYHLEPLEYTFDPKTYETLEAARASLVDHSGAEDRIASAVAAVRSVAGPDEPVDTLAGILEKHTLGFGVLDDVFADPAVSEVFVNAPADHSTLRVRAGGRSMRSNVHLSERGVATLASKVRRESGRAFSRADPTIDALLTDLGSTPAVRVSGVQEPASDGTAFAFRAEGTDTWRLSTLVELNTLTPAAAGLLSVAMERGASLLVAGPRGAGKTTLAAALLWELPQAARLLAIEDTPELPITALQTAGRDAQRIHASAGDAGELDPDDALHTALRFGDGAIAVGEVRGPEAAVLYEAMRVGAAGDAVIGTIHGEGYSGVKERVVSDLGVSASSFAVTDLLVTIAPMDVGRRVVMIEEVSDDGASVLFTYADGTLRADPRLDRGNSRFVASLAGPSETYADVRVRIQERTAEFEDGDHVSQLGVAGPSVENHG
ncbi:MAG: ATPase, T2SS/T4P/T4SS family [Halodesulfurarchaeum sp.]